MDPDFERDGFEVVGGVLSGEMCERLLDARQAGFPAPLDWGKGLGATSRLVYETATSPQILVRVVQHLGKNVVLWGAGFVTRAPGQVHSPHVDIESARDGVRTLSVWIGLKNISRDSALQLISGSHRLDDPVQRVADRRGLGRGEFTLDDALGWAAESDPEARLVSPDMKVGDAIFFDGRLWHGSDNRTAFWRQALLLQYATSDSPMRIPDTPSFEWPFRFLDSPRPACVVVSGDAKGDVNRIVAPPRPIGRRPFLTSLVRPIPTEPLVEHRGFSSVDIARGVSANLAELGCHVSFLDPAVTPHEPHTHVEEELLVMLSGHAVLVWEGSDGATSELPVDAGAIAYYPAGHAHTIRAVGDEPAGYLMFKWTGPERGEAVDTLAADLVSEKRATPTSGSGYAAEVLFRGSTRYLDALQCHVTSLEPGGGYDAHVDAHDVAIVVLTGTLETSGARIEGPAVVFSSGGEPLDMRNVGPDRARYVVFEFHGQGLRHTVDDGAPVSAATSSPAPPASVELHVARPRHRGWAGVWVRGGRALERFPRVRRLVKRVLRPASPWRKRS